MALEYLDGMKGAGRESTRAAAQAIMEDGVGEGKEDEAGAGRATIGSDTVDAAGNVVTSAEAAKAGRIRKSRANAVARLLA